MCGAGEKLGQNWEKLTSLEWFQTWSAGVEHIFRGNKCPQLPGSAVTMTNASGAYTEIIAEYVMASVLYFGKEVSLSRARARTLSLCVCVCVCVCVSLSSLCGRTAGADGEHAARRAQ